MALATSYMRVRRPKRNDLTPLRTAPGCLDTGGSSCGRCRCLPYPCCPARTTWCAASSTIAGRQLIVAAHLGVIGARAAGCANEHAISRGCQRERTTFAGHCPTCVTCAQVRSADDGSRSADRFPAVMRDIMRDEAYSVVYNVLLGSYLQK
jgi:hypothetical protein